MFTLVAWATRLHDGRSPMGSLDEKIELAAATLCARVLIYCANLLATALLMTGPSLPLSVPLIATLCAILIMAWGPARVRATRENAAAADRTQQGQPLLVIGAGNGGRQLIKSMRRSDLPVVPGRNPR